MVLLRFLAVARAGFEGGEPKRLKRLVINRLGRVLEDRKLGVDCTINELRIHSSDDPVWGCRTELGQSKLVFQTPTKSREACLTYLLSDPRIDTGLESRRGQSYYDARKQV